MNRPRPTAENVRALIERYNRDQDSDLRRTLKAYLKHLESGFKRMQRFRKKQRGGRS
jgi:hypothetical protein